MNNKIHALTKTPAQSVTRRALLKKFGLGIGLALVVTLTVFVAPGDTPGGNPGGIAVTGNSDWSIVPAAIAPPFVFNGTDGEIYIRHLPLVGRITLAGRAISIQGKISADFNADLDGTYTGPLWSPVTITANDGGSKTVIFEGSALGNTVGLVSTATIKLNGRGPYAGARLELELTEIGPGNTDTYTLKGSLINGSGN
jgi:hypothetical protein